MTIESMTLDQAQVLDILARHANHSPAALASGDALADIGIDSLTFIVVILEIEQQLQRALFDIENIGQLRTVSDVLHVVGQSQPL